jgi:crotonobetainyl-CoA:carnitine CoA-transferase CaiB-like acyl-CoA transferase
MENPELVDDQWLDPMYRIEHLDELAAHIYVFTLQHTKEELLDIGLRRKVPIGVALTPSDLLESAPLAERAVWAEVSSPAGTCRVPGRPFVGVGWSELDRLHEPGEDTSAVVKEWTEGALS